MYSRLY